jgi:hypothetical protein
MKSAMVPASARIRSRIREWPTKLQPVKTLDGMLELLSIRHIGIEPCIEIVSAAGTQLPLHDLLGRRAHAGDAANQ